MQENILEKFSFRLFIQEIFVYSFYETHNIPVTSFWDQEVYENESIS